MTNIVESKKVLFYDIETMFMLAYIFSLGEQYIRHGQLHPAADSIRIICISYCFNDGKKPQSLTWDGTEVGYKKMLEDFDAIVKSADIVIGKNNLNFDNKEINTQRWLHQIAPFPDWAFVTDDLEIQLRRNFRLPSNTLDYVSHILGLGGKKKMEQDDWKCILNYVKTLEMWMALYNTDIENGITNLKISYNVPVLERLCNVWFKETLETVIKNGKKAWDKMITYNKKDVVDTRIIWNSIKDYVVTKPIYDLDAFKLGDKCKYCINGVLTKGGIRNLVSSASHFRFRQLYQCKSCRKKFNGKLEVQKR